MFGKIGVAQTPNPQIRSHSTPNAQRSTPNTRPILTAVLSLLLLAARAPVRADEPAPTPETRELYRIRIDNRTDGPVEVSETGGQEWMSLGKVTRPAAAVAQATPVVGIVTPGAVVGVTPDQVLIRVPADKNQLRSLRVAARGESANAATILTDIPSRGSLFRCLAPPVGSRVLLDREQRTSVLPPTYTPQAGDRLVILVSGSTEGEPPSIILENKPGGEVLLATTGGLPRILGKVKQPLRGIGRYAGTERGGSGSVLSWSPTAILVSTSGTARKIDENDQPGEERGGFVIQPAEPRLQGATHLPSQMLVEAVPEGEVKPPVCRFFGLPVPLSTGDPLDKSPTRVDVRIDEGAWEPLPDLRGAVNEENMPKALEQALGPDRKVAKGITHLRFTFGAATQTGLRRRIRLASTPASEKIQRGRVTITANVMGDGVAFVRFHLDGRQVKLTNLPPYAWEWDSRTAANGEHLVEIQGLDARGTVVTNVVTKVIVDN